MFTKIFRKSFNKKRIHEIDPEDIFLDSSNLSSLDTERLEGTIGKPISEYAPNLVFGFLILIFLIFTFRLYEMQVINYESYKNKSDNNRESATIIFASRGQILDRNGVPLASNNIVTTSSGILKREYITSGGFANILGYLSYPKADNAGNYWRDNYQGKAGIELYYNDILNGKNGEKIIEKDVAQNIEGDNIISGAVNGSDLTLSIDSDLQKEMYNSIESVVASRGYVSGTGVLMNIKNGEILAMTTYPEYDNNLMTNASGTIDSQKIYSLLTDPRTPFLDRAVSGLFTPGSTVKTFVAYASLKEGIITPQKKINSVGQLVIKNPYGGPDSIFRDWKAHGWIDVVRAIAESSDEYFYQVGGGFQNQKGLGIEKINEYSNFFGLIEKTGIDLPGEVSGVIPNPEWKRINFIDGDWNIGNTYHTSIGQYGFQVTPLALLRATAALGNGGFLVTPHLYLNSSSTEMVNKVWAIKDLNLDQNVLSYIHEGMKDVVQAGGTEPQLNITGLKIAAKSGTAELGIKKLTVNSLIVGYFPYDDPQYAFVFVMENGNIGDRSGSVQAAIPFLTYFRDYKKEYLK